MAGLIDEERARDRASRKRLRELRQVEAHRKWLRGKLKAAIECSEQHKAGAYGVLGWLLGEACFEQAESEALTARVLEAERPR